MRFLSPTSYCHKTKQVVGYPFHWQMRGLGDSLWALRPLVLFSGSCIAVSGGPQRQPGSDSGQHIASASWTRLLQAPGQAAGPSFKTPGWLLRADARVSVCLNWFPSILDTIWTGKMTHKDSP